MAMQYKNQDNPKKYLFFLVAFFGIIIVYIKINHHYNLKEDYKRKVNFLVSKKVEIPKALYEYYDANAILLPLKSQEFHKKPEILTGDSIVKNANSYDVNVYRRGYESGYEYVLAEKFKLK